MPAKKHDYHAVLGLTIDASDDAIRAAYKKLALQWHPDRHLVGKEGAAQMFIEVNQAYHALMDGKESTHSSSTETSSTTSAPTGSSAEPAHSNTHPKSTQASSRPPSASSNSSKRSSPKSSNSSSSPLCDDHGTNTSKSSSQSRASPSTSSSSHGTSDDDLKSRSHPRPAKASPNRNQFSSDRMKNGRKSHDHLRDPPSTAPKTTTPASTHSRSSDGLSGSVRSKSSEKTSSSSPAGPEMKHNSRPEKTSRTGTGRSRTTKPVIPPPSGHLHRSPKFGFADDFVHKLSRGATTGKREPPDSFPPDATPCGSPLRAINTPRGASKEWIFPLPLTLDEMYHGTTYRFLVTRELLSRRTEQVEISIDIPPGMRSGTRIVCPRTGHQRKDGALQDVVFLVEEVPEERFSRVKDDLFLDVCIPWADPLADQGGEICIQGIDGKEITFTLPYPIYDKATEGQVLVKGAGMPIRDGRRTIGRGDMIVRWRVVFAAHHSKWQTLRRALHLDA
ncbi:DnaJ-domain-containing protein [Imleria badia]|nr:DnaJ-domain-containing protein [Imleria badia]